MSKRQATVLIVDDDPVIRQLISVNLEMEGYAVLEAGDGEEGIARVREHHPDVVLLDVMMPQVDGWVAAMRLRTDPSTQDVRIALVTARAQQRDRDRGEQLGVDAYICKPFDPTELVEVCDRLAAERT